MTFFFVHRSLCLWASNMNIAWAKHFKLNHNLLKTAKHANILWLKEWNATQSLHLIFNRKIERILHFQSEFLLVLSHSYVFGVRTMLWKIFIWLNCLSWKDKELVETNGTFYEYFYNKSSEIGTCACAWMYTMFLSAFDSFAQF